MAENITLKAPDISCGHCVNAIQTRLGDMDGVENVEASAESKLVKVWFDGEKVHLDQIREALADEGYPAEDA